MIEIEQYCDGWSIIIDGEDFSWDHNDEDMGVNTLKKVFEHLGYTVTIEECY